MRTICAILCVIHVIAGQEIDEPLPSKQTGNVNQRMKLYNHLMKDYQKNIFPDKANLTFGVALMDLDLNEIGNILETNVWLRHTWMDSRLEWDPKAWGGIEVLHVPSAVVWKPDITLYNIADQSARINACHEPNVLVYSNGNVLWVPPCHFKSQCELPSNYHFETQTCVLKFASWTFDGDTMDLNLYNNKTEIDMSDFVNVYYNPKWKVVNTTAVRNSKLYTCCSEPYIDLTFFITVQRKPEFANNSSGGTATYLIGLVVSGIALTTIF